MRESHAMRSGSEGVAPENMSTAPASNVNTASSFGATAAVSVPNALPHCTTWCLRW
jgi:hypothetical protein